MSRLMVHITGAKREYLMKKGDRITMEIPVSSILTIDYTGYNAIEVTKEEANIPIEYLVVNGKKYVLES